MNEGIKSCADKVIQELSKEFQAGYDFALNKLNLPANIELRVVEQRPKKLKEKGEEEQEDAEEPQHNIDDVITDLTFQKFPYKGQVSDGDLVENNAPTTDAEAPVDSKVPTIQNSTAPVET